MVLVLIFGLLALAMSILGWWVLALRRSLHQIASRIEALTQPEAAPQAIAVPGVPQVAPSFMLPDLDGRMVALRDLLASGKRLLVTFTDPKCGPCYDLLADVGGWERVYGDGHGLTFVTISGGDVAQNRMLAREYGLGRVLLQQEHEVADAFSLAMLPSAALIERDGRIVDAALGAGRVRDLVALALGLVVPTPVETAVQSLRLGQSVGDLRRPDLDGTMIELGKRQATSTFVLFWSPGCHHCQDLIPTLREWDADAEGRGMVVVTTGPTGLSRELGLRAPMIPDDDGVLKRTFGVQGTPSSVLIDRNGRIVTEVVRGVSNVSAMGAWHFGQSTHLA